ncbi:MAG TPA: DUF3806 domain-containing protein [Spongiibacteraceae bacterium]|jgi:hypothetical protein|nr:DUF3806 domain-containing protein [Spongiibacteraceae bacterium]HUH36622.1 DUF3806 domain-containing protein [Spongiibacteraceae bacterium]
MTRYIALAIWLACIGGLSTGSATAQEWRSSELTLGDQTYMSEQRAHIDALARRELGMQLRGTPDNDLQLLQRLLDEHVISGDDTAELQAMGVVLGDLLKDRYGLLWKIYEDKRGRSRALEIPGHGEFLFPITMISRRAEVGIKVDVEALWKKAGDIVLDVRGPSAW